MAGLEVRGALGTGEEDARTTPGLLRPAARGPARRVGNAARPVNDELADFRPPRDARVAGATRRRALAREAIPH